MTTLNGIVAQARSILKDGRVPYRYSDEDLRVYGNEAIQAACRMRPEFMIAGGTGYPPTVPVPTDQLPVDLDRFYSTALVDYIVGRAMMRDDQYMDEGQAAMFMQKFAAAIVAGGV